MYNKCVFVQILLEIWGGLNIVISSIVGSYEGTLARRGGIPPEEGGIPPVQKLAR